MSKKGQNLSADAEALKQVEREVKAAEREAVKQAKLEAKESAKMEREIAKAAKEQAKLEAKKEREANRQPEQNGIRRPSPTSLCGLVWVMADELSSSLGQPTPISNLLEAGVAKGLNVSNIRTEYARWKKYHGLSGRFSLQATAE